MIMKTISKYVMFGCLLMLCQYVHSQKVSNKGQEFWVGYGHHQYMETGSNTQNMVLYLSAESQPATVTITLDSSGFTPALWYKKTYNIPAFTCIATENMPKGTVNAAASGSNPNYDARLYTDPPPFGSGGEGIFRKKGIHIQSNVDIVVYAHIYGSVSSGATVLLPVNSWGYKYTSLNSRQIDAAGPGYSWMYIVAKEDNTRIKITPSVVTRLNKPANTSFNVDLQKGQIYQIIGQSDNGGNGNEFTGTKVESIPGADGNCHPVGGFSGSSRTRGEDVPCGSGSGRDNDMQQMFPEQTWGKRYATAPFSTASGSSSSPTLNASVFMTHVYKIAVQDPTTVVKRNGVVLTGLINNLYYKYSSNTADLIEGDKPIAVAQFMSGSSTCNPGSYGDPEMVFLPPIEQGIAQCYFYRNTKEQIYANYVTIVVPTAGVASLKIDNSSVFSYQYPHPNLPGYTVVIKGWAAAQAQASIKCDSVFNAITYGLGGAESYAYIAGAYLANLNAISGLTNNPGIDTTKKLNLFNCVNTPVKLSVLYRLNAGTPPPLKLVIKMSTLGGVVTPNADVTLNPATSFLSDTVTVKGLDYYQFDLPGTYLFNAPATYYLPVVATNTATGLCTDEEKLLIEVVVKPKAYADFSTIIPSCPTDTVTFTGVLNGNGYTIKKWAWEFPLGSPFNDSSQIVRYTFAGQGNYNVKLTAFTDDACSADTTKIINLPAGPTTTFVVSPTSLCEGGQVTITPGATVGTKWFWDFGDGTKDTLTNGNPFTHTYTTAGSYTISHALDNGTSCKPSATPQQITVNANPFATFTFPAGCLPSNGVAQFNSTAFASDGQAITGHAWNFGDPASGANNTSTLSNPSHSYTVNTYTITYRATTINGCFKDTSVTTTFNVTPVVQFTALTDVCDSTLPVSVANGSVTNGVPGTGVYSGLGTSSSGMFDPAAAGVGTHTIWYVFTSTTGSCQDSLSQTITVKPVPKAGFSFPTGCLLNSNVQFTDTTQVPTGLNPTYLWSFGEPSSGVNNISSITSPAHNYASGGTYNVQQIVTLNGCADTALTPVLVKVKPQLSYPALAGVCATLAPFSVASATVTNGVPGTGIYKGPGITNSNGTFDPVIAGIGNHQIWFVFTSTDNCVDSISSTISVGPAPTASFTFPTNCLSTGNVQFTNNSSIPSGSVPTYTWDFGDPSSGANNTSGLQSPSHLYPGEGVRNVKLTVSLNGCSKDSTIAITVKIQPQISFPAQTDVCLNVAQYALIPASNTNGVTGIGKYTGNGIIDTIIGTFNPLVAGVGTHPITYTYTTAFGCTATSISNVIVKSVPTSSFTFPTTCLPDLNVQFTNTSTGATTYSWDFGDGTAFSSATSPLHLYSGSGPFNVKLTAISNGCSKDTIIPVTVKVQPVISFPVQSPVCFNVPPFALTSAIITNGVSGAGTYTGTGITNASTGIFSPAVSGVGSFPISYSFASTLGCNAVANSNVVVKAIPVSSFTFPTNCLPNSNVQFANTSTGATTYVWDFGDGTPTSTVTSPLHTFTSSGPFNVKLTATDNGCSKDTTIPVTVKVQPIISFPAQNPVCANLMPFTLALASITNSVAGTGSYTGTGMMDTINGVFDPRIAGVGSHQITYRFISTLGCSSTSTVTIQVKSVPIASFTYPTGCLPNGLVQFTNGSTGATGGNFVWNFGDPGSGANNSSTAQNPQHSYTTFGAYTIMLTATLNGCSDDTTITATFALQPQLAYPAIPSSVCQGVDVISLATAIVLNGVSGTGTYTGTGIDNAGNFSPNVAGVGSHQITYTYTSTLGNCVSTINRNIIVNPKPTAGIILTDSICANKTVTIRSNSNIVSGSITQWQWNIAGVDTIFNNSLPFTQIFSSEGNYDITLKVVSDSGCVSSVTSKTLHIGAIPLADFSSPSEVCMPNGSVRFTDASSISDNSTMKHLWNFGDGSAIDTTANPIHLYNSSADTAFIKLIVTSNFGCIDDTTKPIVFRKKPYVNFIPQSDTLCQGQQIIFYALSNPPVGSDISSYSWNFGDGSAVSNDTNAIKKYTIPGDYLVRLSVQTNNGCIGDTSRLIRVNLQPVIDAGSSFYAHLGELVTFNPAVNSPSVTFQWSPSTGLNNINYIRPTLKTTATQTYYLTATGKGGCTAVDSLKVNLLNPITIPNAFSPNGDGVNDRWELANLKDYPNSTVDVFNRYGQSVFKAAGNVKAWNGTNAGKELPIGTYYYVIDLRDGTKPFTGYVVILK